MKKRTVRWLALAVALVLSVGVFAACGEQEEALKANTTEERQLVQKLKKIRSDWSYEQVLDWMGEPDEYGQMSFTRDFFYKIDENRTAWIACLGSGDNGTVVEIRIYIKGQEEPFFLLGGEGYA